MSGIEEIPQDMDEKIEDNDLSQNSSIPNADRDEDDRYNFERTTIVIGLQILPATDRSEQQVIIAAGIQGKPPILGSASLNQIEECQAITEILARLKQALPQIAESAKIRAEKQRQLDQKQQKTVVSPPKLPPLNSKPQPSNQLSLF
ncbi:MAG: hypothetical protein N4J56_004503 [Chroococcidiopsis sp. SAG 2025]|uniref:hypothetical protein n=1 Tax=Chroococcidiopsis sp. SAG 2025 TaxID=171389 RepID=UPI002936D58B|nr:hypothetical protein [Chroococcidiopsis sp. SAG 2025]MDV2994849.1 hypothetical protein [Chroococcidiopsis sp. SAG 2025]